MPVNVPGNNTYPANVSVPIDGDAPTGAILGQPSRDLADRTTWLRAQLTAGVGDGTSSYSGSATWATVNVPTDGGVNTSLTTNALIPIVNRTTWLRDNTVGDGSTAYAGMSTWSTVHVRTIGGVATASSAPIVALTNRTVYVRNATIGDGTIVNYAGADTYPVNIISWTLSGASSLLSTSLCALADRATYLRNRLGDSVANYAGSSASYPANVSVPQISGGDTTITTPGLKHLADRTAYLRACVGNGVANYAGSSASYPANVSVPQISGVDTAVTSPGVKNLADRTAWLKAAVDALGLSATKPHVTEYTTAGTATWTKPAKADPDGWTEIIAVGGGEPGESRGAAPAGGAGGRAGKVARARYKTSSLPAALYVSVGAGGQRNASGAGPDISAGPSAVRETNSSGAILAFGASPFVLTPNIAPTDGGDYAAGGAGNAPSAIVGDGRPSAYGSGGGYGNSPSADNGGFGGRGYGAGGGGAGGSGRGGGGGGGYGSVQLATRGEPATSPAGVGGSGANGYVQISCDVLAV